MTRKTSIDVYKAIVEDGIVADAAAAAYSILYNHGPLTQNEMRSHGPVGEWWNPETVRKRISELSAMDVVEIVGKRACEMSGRTCYVWDVTGKMPTRIDRKESKDETIKRLTDRVASLEAEVARLTPRKRQLELFG